MINKKEIAGIKACDYVKSGMVVGIGTGSTASYMIQELAKRYNNGLLEIECVSTSKESYVLAKKLGLPLKNINEVDGIDIAIDGVDEIDFEFNAIKGGGGALLREKIVATLAKKVIWIMDDSKLSNALGSFYVPVEIVPFGDLHIFNKFLELGYNPVLRIRNDKIFITDNGNYIIDLHLNGPLDLKKLVEVFNNTVGVVEHGLFLKMCDLIIVGTENGAEVKNCK